MEPEEIKLRRFCTNWITDFLAVSCLPNDEGIDYWAQEGVRAVVSLVEDWELYFHNGSPTEYFSKLKARGFEVVHVPVPDGSAPPLSELHALVNWIRERVASGKKVVIHCVNGMGRSPTLAIAYLLYSDRKLEEAIRIVAERNPRTSLSNEQYYRLLEYEEFLKLRKSDGGASTLNSHDLETPCPYTKGRGSSR